jgi:hypothetical protein
VELTEISFQSQEEKEPRVVYYKIFGGINRCCELGKVPQSFHYGRLFKQYISRPVIDELLKKINFAAIKARKMGLQS